MKTGLIALLLVLLVVSSASAQRSDDQVSAQLRSGKLKVWWGAALIVGGIVAMNVPPGPAALRPGLQARDAVVGLGSGAVVAGTWLVWSGFQQRQRAAAPHTEMGVALGRQTGVIFRRTW